MDTPTSPFDADVLVTDVTMASMNGLELAERVHAELPLRRDRLHHLEGQDVAEAGVEGPVVPVRLGLVLVVAGRREDRRPGRARRAARAPAARAASVNRRSVTGLP